MIQDSIAGISAWLQVESGAAGVTAHADPSQDVVVFRLDLADGKPLRELEISEEVLGDVPPEEILVDLGRADVPERLRRDPTMRLTFNRDGEVPHLETLVVKCDGRAYRIVRDAQHAVRIFDAKEQVLARSPSPLPVLQMAIFRRSPSRWHEDIRNWRGANQ